MTLVSGGIRLMRKNCGYSRRFPGEGRQTTVGLSRTAIFSVFAGYFFLNFTDDASVIINVKKLTSLKLRVRTTLYRDCTQKLTGPASVQSSA